MKYYDIYVNEGKGFMESLDYKIKRRTEAIEEANYLRSKYYSKGEPIEVCLITKGVGTETCDTIAEI